MKRPLLQFNHLHNVCVWGGGIPLCRDREEHVPSRLQEMAESMAAEETLSDAISGNGNCGRSGESGPHNRKNTDL